MQFLNAVRVCSHNQHLSKRRLTGISRAIVERSYVEGGCSTKPQQLVHSQLAASVQRRRPDMAIYQEQAEMLIKHIQPALFRLAAWQGDSEWQLLEKPAATLLLAAKVTRLPLSDIGVSALCCVLRRALRQCFACENSLFVLALRVRTCMLCRMRCVTLAVDATSVGLLFAAAESTTLSVMLTSSTMPWHFDAARLLCAVVKGRPAYIYILLVPLSDAYRCSRKGCVPVAAAVFVTRAPDADQLWFLFDALRTRVLAASGSGRSSLLFRTGVIVHVHVILTLFLALVVQT